MRPTLLVLLLAFGVSCRASMHAQGSASTSAGADGNAQADIEQNGDQPGAGTAPPAGTSAGEAPVSEEMSASEPPLLGARHDLRLSTEKATTQCKCLAVALGQPDLPAFRWKAAPPNVDANTQLVVAVSSEGMTCEGEPKDSIGASYWGYRRFGNDIVVFVESAGRGKPLTSGAIVPKPFGEGLVYVAPASKKTPYGRGSDGAGRCKLGNPGSVRPLPTDGAAPEEEAGE